MKSFTILGIVALCTTQFPKAYDTWKLSELSQQLDEVVEKEKSSLPRGVDVYTVLTDVEVENEKTLNYTMVSSLYYLEKEGFFMDQALRKRFLSTMRSNPEIKEFVELGLEYNYTVLDRNGVTLLDLTLGKKDLADQ